MRKTQCVAVLCAAVLIFDRPYVFAQSQQPAAGQQSQALSAQQLDSLVAPVALYPDPILSQVLVASTYPIEIVQAARWLKEHPTLKGHDLTAAVAKQPWDSSVQGLVIFPDLLNRLNKDLT